MKHVACNFCRLSEINLCMQFIYHLMVLSFYFLCFFCQCLYRLFHSMSLFPIVSVNKICFFHCVVQLKSIHISQEGICLLDSYPSKNQSNAEAVAIPTSIHNVRRKYVMCVCVCDSKCVHRIRKWNVQEISISCFYPSQVLVRWPFYRNLFHMFIILHALMRFTFSVSLTWH